MQEEVLVKRMILFNLIYSNNKRNTHYPTIEENGFKHIVLTQAGIIQLDDSDSSSYLTLKDYSPSLMGDPKPHSLAKPFLNHDFHKLS